MWNVLLWTSKEKHCLQYSAVQYWTTGRTCNCQLPIMRNKHTCTCFDENHKECLGWKRDKNLNYRTLPAVLSVAQLCEGPGDDLCSLKSYRLLHNFMKKRLQKGLRYVNAVDGYSRSSINRAIHHFLLVVCNNSVTVLRRLRNTATITVFMTTCSHEKSFSFDTSVIITGHACFLIRLYM